MPRVRGMEIIGTCDRISRMIIKQTKGENMQAIVYILKCADNSYYTGVTKRPIDERVGEHNSGVIKGYTSSRLPVELVFTETFDRIDQAIERERQIKGWTRRKKEALIRFDYDALPALSKSTK